MTSNEIYVSEIAWVSEGCVADAFCHVSVVVIYL